MNLFEDTYRTIKRPSEGIFKDRGSKFISRAYPVESEQEVKEILQNLRSEFFDARHHCYAYIIKPDKSISRTNDDGEPSGSAGKPIFNQLLSHDLTNILVVVVRYFGGTKLGIPGLINAYKLATKEAIEANEILEFKVNQSFEISYDYPLMDVVMRHLKDNNCQIIKTEFEMKCRVFFEIRKSESVKVEKIFNDLFGVEIKKD